MKSLAQTFLSQAEQDRVIACVQAVEKRTSGEIVPFIASSSHDYPRAAHLGGLLCSLVSSIAIAMLCGSEDMWTFLVIFLVGYLVFTRLIDMFPALKRPFIPQSEMQEEVAEATMKAFYGNGLHRTRDLTGIIIYVSVFERSVQILADKGINDKVNPKVWDEVVDMITEGIRKGEQGKALCQGVERCGQLVETHCPIRHDDTDELPNLIVEH